MAGGREEIADLRLPICDLKSKIANPKSKIAEGGQAAGGRPAGALAEAVLYRRSSGMDSVRRPSKLMARENEVASAR